jgi:phosphatidylglycerophosphate synthase
MFRGRPSGFVGARHATPRPSDHLGAAVRPRRAADALAWYAWAIDAAVILPAAALLARAYGRRPAARFLAGAAVAGMVRHAFLRWLAARATPEAISAGDPLSLGRFTSGNLVAGLIAGGVRDRSGPAGVLACSMALFGATALDWLDGPLARRSGATRHGAVLDIEADSWLTLWTAIAAAAWGELPCWVVLPPLVRYLNPLLDLRAGALPRGGRPGWGRVMGAAQMALLLGALVPVRRRPPRIAVTIAAAVISGGQLAAHLLQLRRRLHR